MCRLAKNGLQQEFNIRLITLLLWSLIKGVVSNKKKAKHLLAVKASARKSYHRSDLDI